MGSASLPAPEFRFRLACWRAFQRALDPLAPPRRLPWPPPAPVTEPPRDRPEAAGK